MPADSVQELLGLPPSAKRANAYEIFGLTADDATERRVATAIDEQVARLRAARATTPEPIWKAAAAAVQNARATLLDPALRARLDKKLGVGADQTPAEPVDPLAAFLTPAAAARPVATGPPKPPADPVARSEAVDLADPPTINPPIADPPEVVAPVAVAPVRSQPRRRRRKSPLVPLFLFSVIVALLVGSGFLIYQMFLGSGGIKVVREGNAITFRTGEAADRGVPRAAAAAPPRARPPAPPSDAVLDPPPPPPTDFDASLSLGNSIDQPPPETMPQPVPPPPEADSISDEATDRAIAAGQTAIDAATAALARADWPTMKPAAEAALRAAADPAQQAAAQTLYEAADLATFYREGIRRAVAGLQSGAEFDINDSVKVLVVEASPQRLVVRRGAENKTFDFDRLPISITRSVIQFALPGSPTTRAAGAVFESIAAKATPEHRTEAIQTLHTLNGQIDGGDGPALADLIASLPPKPAPER